MAFKPTKPTHRIKVQDKQTNASGVIGSAWLNASGSMSITLNPGVVLSWQDDVRITAFPVDSKKLTTDEPDDD